jgi:hypothetical protein
MISAGPDYKKCLKQPKENPFEQFCYIRAFFHAFSSQARLVRESGIR